jgi:orotidine-5'-phosphate decarboxylase
MTNLSGDTTNLSTVNRETEARSHLALALDLDDLVAVLRMARPLVEYFSVAKVGLELFCAAGPETVGALTRAGFDVFIDLKLHDIPTTVGRAARVLGGLGVSYATVHTSGGLAMVEAATISMAEGADAAGLPSPSVLGVTVLTSDSDAPPEELARRAAIAADGGCGGVVCAASDLAVVSAAAPGLLKVVPGIRPSQVGADDQARVATPGDAIRAGADLLVIGRAVTASADPEAAAASVRDEVAEALRLERP